MQENSFKSVKYIVFFLFIFQLVAIQLHAQDAENEVEQDTVATVRVIRVALKEAPPFIIKDEAGEYSGLSISLWTKIAENLGVTYEYKEYEDLITLLDAVKNGEADLGISPITITSQRLENYKFSQPFYISSLGIAMQKSNGGMWFAFLKNLFSFNFFRAVMVLFAILFIFGLLIWLAERNKNAEMFPPGLKGLGDGFWWSAVTMTTVGYGDKSPVTKFGRLISLIWMFSAIILISSLTASIASALTVRTLGSNIENVQDLRKFSVATVKGSSGEAFLDVNRIRHTAYNSALEAIEDVSEEKIEAFVYDTPITKFFIHENGKENSVEVLPNYLTTDYYGFVSSKQETILHDIDPILLEVINTPYWKEQLKIYYSGNSSE